MLTVCCVFVYVCDQHSSSTSTSLGPHQFSFVQYIPGSQKRSSQSSYSRPTPQSQSHAPRRSNLAYVSVPPLADRLQNPIYPPVIDQSASGSTSLRVAASSNIFPLSPFESRPDLDLDNELSSPLRSTELTQTTIPRKRGRPPKNKTLPQNEFRPTAKRSPSAVLALVPSMVPQKRGRSSFDKSSSSRKRYRPVSRERQFQGPSTVPSSLLQKAPLPVASLNSAHPSPSLRASVTPSTLALAPYLDLDRPLEPIRLSARKLDILVPLTEIEILERDPQPLNQTPIFIALRHLRENYRAYTSCSPSPHCPSRTCGGELQVVASVASSSNPGITPDAADTNTDSLSQPSSPDLMYANDNTQLSLG